MVKNKELGLAVVGCGRVGRMRSTIAKDFPGIGWIGLTDMNEALGRKLKDDINADFFTTDYHELIARPEVDAVIIATSTWHHVEPTLAAVERKLPMLIEKPLATMFVWAPIPEPFRAMGSLDFSKRLLREAGVAVSPGIGFGDQGEGFVRFALVENKHRIRQAVRGIRRFVREAKV